MDDLLAFRADLKLLDVGDIIDKHVLNGAYKHVSEDNVQHIRRSVAVSYGVDVSEVNVLITGSANLGFSTSEKRKRGVVTHQRYRLFSEASDIDVAVISPSIQKLIWNEISLFYSGSAWFPARNLPLGDYLVSGWFRPDHFPRVSNMMYCRTWYQVFHRLSAHSRFHKRDVRGGLFASVEQLRYYVARSIRECMALEA